MCSLQTQACLNCSYQRSQLGCFVNSILNWPPNPCFAPWQPEQPSEIPTYDHVTLVFKSFQWLPIPVGIKFISLARFLGHLTPASISQAFLPRPFFWSALQPLTLTVIFIFSALPYSLGTPCSSLKTPLQYHFPREIFLDPSMSSSP